MLHVTHLQATHALTHSSRNTTLVHSSLLSTYVTCLSTNALTHSLRTWRVLTWTCCYLGPRRASPGSTGPWCAPSAVHPCTRACMHVIAGCTECVVLGAVVLINARAACHEPTCISCHRFPLLGPCPPDLLHTSSNAQGWSLGLPS